MEGKGGGGVTVCRGKGGGGVIVCRGKGGGGVTVWRGREGEESQLVCRGILDEGTHTIHPIISCTLHIIPGAMGCILADYV